MKQTLNLMLSALGLKLAPWMAPLAAALLALLFLPLYRVNFRTKQARKRMVRAGAARPEQRDALTAEALGLVTGNPMGLIVVAEEALNRGMRPVAEEAVRQLAETGKRRPELRRLQRQLSDERPTTAEAEAAAIEHLLESGMREKARERLQRARERFPGAEALAEIDVDEGRGD
ncbi:MAG: hypothetical protein H6739_35180 [Alphaproteobacteria bacterium]|nr:hypothetical protein [Alphaproteobacteria bacterium]